MEEHYRVRALGFASVGPGVGGAELQDWLSGLGVAPEARVALVLRLGEFRALHAAVVEVLTAVAEGRIPAPDAVVRLNETAALVPFAPRLSVEGGRPLLVDEPVPGARAADVVAAVARSAIRLAGSSDVRRLRRCPACGTLFLASRPDRIWCGLACGNRVRVARHHARRRAAGVSA